MGRGVWRKMKERRARKHELPSSTVTGQSPMPESISLRNVLIMIVAIIYIALTRS